MAFKWTKESVTWFDRAARSCRFHRALAEKISPWLSPADNIADIGCGLGFLSRELSPFAASISCIDIDPLAVSYVTAHSSTAKNIIPCAGSWEHFCSPDSYDVIVMSFFGRIFQYSDLMRYMSCTRRALIYIVNASAQSPHSPSGRSSKNKQYSDSFERLLADFHMAYEKVCVSEEFGQPLLSPDEACRFVSHYHREYSKDEITDYLSENLVKTQHGFYLPCRKNIDIYRIDKNI